jgi:hypothetical protein
MSNGGEEIHRRNVIFLSSQVNIRFSRERLLKGMRRRSEASEGSKRGKAC